MINKNSEFDFINTFPPLGHPEHHFNKYQEYHWLKSLNEVKKWLEKSLIIKGMLNNFKINEDLTVSANRQNIVIVRGDVSKENLNDNDCIYIIMKKGSVDIPIKFRKTNTFKVIGREINNLIGTPYWAYELKVLGEISSLKGLSKNILTINLKDAYLHSFEGMPEYLIDNEILFKLNDIKSFNEFTNASKIMLSQYEWNEKKSYDLLIKIPDCVKNVYSDIKAVGSKVVFSDEFGLSVDMEWLYKEKEMLKRTKQLKEDVNNSIEVMNINKKRKV